MWAQAIVNFTFTLQTFADRTASGKDRRGGGASEGAAQSYDEWSDRVPGETKFSYLSAWARNWDQCHRAKNTVVALG